MPLIRFSFSALLAITIITIPTFALAEEKLALNSTVSAAPEWLPSVRDVKIELILQPDLIEQSLWPRIRSGFAMKELDDALVSKHEQWYASRPDYIARMTGRAGRYLFYITEEVERRGMPSEIALLPMIESAFNPVAYSSGHASGIWQFIPSTGKNFGMQQNWWYDGRRDIVSATNGALDYLQKLHGMFGDWELALAAYNCGEGTVGRAQARNRKLGLPTDYRSLKLPTETRNYVPKLIAIKNIIANPENFELALQEIPNKAYFSTVSTTKHIDVKLAAQLADISVEEFTALNPAHNRPVILQDSSDLILLPIDSTATFLSNLESYDKPLVSWQSYKPKKGEKFDRLAPRFGLSAEKLKSINGLSSGKKVSSGQTLLVPINSEVETDVDFKIFNMQLATDSRSKTRKGTVKHTVRKGDTLSEIAQKYQVSISKLKKWNGSMKTIRIGQTIIVGKTSNNT